MVRPITQCPYCIDIHSGNARKAGTADAEMVDAAMIAAPCEPERQSHTRRTLCQIKPTPPNRALRALVTSVAPRGRVR